MAFSLGFAKTQVHKNYIISQTSSGIIIVDQHAAHERILYEKLKLELKIGMASQELLVPEIIHLSEYEFSIGSCIANTAVLKF